MATRSPICTVVGHIDHGKSSILDKIRGTAIVAGEAGQITQAIGASIIPASVILAHCADLLKKLGIQLTLPGLLFIDTPGHAAFTHLRKRGGNLADIAIVVVDINEGIKPQTVECIEILKHYKTPFLVAANKIDLLPGWQTKKEALLACIQKQPESVQRLLDTKLYELVGKLSQYGFNSERFDRVDDFTKQIAIVPVSAKTGEGIAELLMVMAGLAQKYLAGELEVSEKGAAKGTILEIKEDKGLGKTMDAILYDGMLKEGDTIVVGSLGEPIVAKVKALFEPLPLEEMRDRKSKFKRIKKVTAATGVKISAPGTEEAVAGMPLRSAKAEDVERVKEEIQKEVEEVLLETDPEGLVIKADSLGSLEALMTLLREKHIQIRKASIGNITKKDIADADSCGEKDPLMAVVLGFNVSLLPGVQSSPVKVLTDAVIYTLIEKFEEWQDTERKRQETSELDVVTKPCKIQLMKGYVFRQSNPAVVGVDVLMGTLKVGTTLMKKDGHALTTVKGIQMDQENIEKAEKGKQVAVSLDRVMVGRQIVEGDVLYSYVSEEDFRKMKELKQHLNQQDKDVLKEIASIMRKENPLWGI